MLKHSGTINKSWSCGVLTSQFKPQPEYTRITNSRNDHLQDRKLQKFSDPVVSDPTVSSGFKWQPNHWEPHLLKSSSSKLLSFPLNTRSFPLLEAQFVEWLGVHRISLVVSCRFINHLCQKTCGGAYSQKCNSKGIRWIIKPNDVSKTSVSDSVPNFWEIPWFNQFMRTKSQKKTAAKHLHPTAVAFGHLCLESWV